MIEAGFERLLELPPLYFLDTITYIWQKIIIKLWASAKPLRLMR